MSDGEIESAVRVIARGGTERIRGLIKRLMEKLPDADRANVLQSGVYYRSLCLLDESGKRLIASHLLSMLPVAARRGAFVDAHRGQGQQSRRLMIQILDSMDDNPNIADSAQTTPHRQPHPDPTRDGLRLIVR